MKLKAMLLLPVLLFSSLSHAERWFEVEFIAFEQQPNPQLREDFSLSHAELKGKNQRDLLTDGFNLYGQKECLNGKREFPLAPLAEQLLSASNVSRYCPDNFNYLDSYDPLPLSPAAEPQEHTDAIYLLDSSQLQMQDVVTKLRRKGLKPMLHTGWRFPEQSERRAPNMVIYAGKRFAAPSSYEAVSNRVANAGYQSLLQPEFGVLQQPEPDLWQLQGLMKIHVRHYLFITTDFDYRYYNLDGGLESARFSQFTRVYSGDIHYLDHPKMGMIIQIRKYQH
ncbi:CsiV family protein [Pseudoalteromonas fenneropenaei]|uniref:CsiV family protein n=1 Tax=Pseudoalteromonas fenneropenaei TaxID=1737459 RepID=A0ABV7CFB2_9GAMM